MPTYTSNTTFTVTVSGSYDLSAFGAQGGSSTNGRLGTFSGGLGAQAGGVFTLQAGDLLRIVTGGQGVDAATPAGGAGGGGGTFILGSTNGGTTYSLLLAAGGGGGAGFNQTGGAGSATFGTTSAGGTGGDTAGGGGGAGFQGAGVNASQPGGGFGASSYTSFGAGGGGGANGGVGGGGGGGGGSNGIGGGGGGGGYTGGNGSASGFGGAAAPSFGGLSYNAGVVNAAETGSGVHSGSGSATITFLAPAPPAAPCYVTGTRIRGLRGCTIRDRPVETMRVGDLVLTAAGKPRPIRWIGSRSYSGLTAPKHDRPVRIRAGALADDVPARDLLVSPDHCLWLDGLLVAAGHLVNGTSITRGEAVPNLAYWHVELDSHDMLLAENTPAESFLAAPGVRGQFDRAQVSDAATAPAPYAPRIEPGPELTALRARLIRRAGLSVGVAPRLGSMRAWMDKCDGRRVAGWAQDTARPQAPVCLDIVVDGEIVAMTLAEEYRADIAAAGVGEGHHGFDVDLDEPLAPGTAHTVEVRRSGDGLRVCAMAVDAAGMWTPLLAA